MYKVSKETVSKWVLGPRCWVLSPGGLGIVQLGGVLLMELAVQYHEYTM